MIERKKSASEKKKKKKKKKKKRERERERERERVRDRGTCSMTFVGEISPNPVVVMVVTAKYKDNRYS